MLVVADTSPLNYLVLIGCVDILPQLHQKVLIPSAVRRELLSVSAPPEVRAWASNLPDWVEEIDPSPEFLNDPQLINLHEGERAALALAASRQPIFLLIDEWPARGIAIRKGFLVTGTLGVLDQAASRKLISFAEAIGKLKSTSFRYPAALVERLLAEHDPSI
ncbi:MAG TPA: DUF3368 domain-containing protein [Bryobacteraceae bacterium]|nr:DUF3368 domain-containing protein [Bryobacteraceae bacterium]